jgi:hypothetical protein
VEGEQSANERVHSSQSQEAQDRVEGEADDDVDGKDLEDDEEDAGEEDADEDVSCRTYSRTVS